MAISHTKIAIWPANNDPTQIYVIQNLAHEVILGNDIIKKHEVYTDGKFAYYSLRKKEATAFHPQQL